MKYGIAQRFKSFLNPLSIIEGKEDLTFNFFKSLNKGYNKDKPITEGFNANAYVYAITNLIATLGADVPISVEKVNKSTKEAEPITDGEVYDFVFNPNSEQTYKEYTYNALLLYLLTGNVFEYTMPIVGFNSFETHLLYNQNLDIEADYNITGAFPTSYRYTLGGKSYNLTPDDVNHIRSFNPNINTANPTLGMSPLEAGYRTLIASNEVITADASLMKNKGAIGMLTNRSEEGITTEEVKILDEVLRKRIGGSSNYGKISTTSANLDYIKFAMSPTDLKIIESGVMKLRDLCSIYGVKSSLFNDTSASTYNNQKEDSKGLYTRGVLPPLEKFIEIRNKVYLSRFKDDRYSYRIVLNTDKIEPLQEDQSKEMSKSKMRSEIVRNIVEGVGVKWDKDSGVAQLIDALGITEEEAIKLIGNEKKEDKREED